MKTHWTGKGGQIAVKGTKGFISGRDVVKVRQILNNYYKTVEPEVLLAMKQSMKKFFDKTNTLVPFDTGNLLDSMGGFVFGERGREVFSTSGTHYATRIQHWRNPVTGAYEKGYGRNYFNNAKFGLGGTNTRHLQIRDAKACVALIAAIPYALSLDLGLISHHKGWFSAAAASFSQVFPQEIALALHGTVVSGGNGDLGFARESYTGL